MISESPRVETEYKNLRWNVFHNFEPGQMLTNIQTYVFPFINTIGEGKDTAFSLYMKDTVFLIPTAKVLAKVVDGIDAMDMNNKDIMGDVYEYLLGKIAAAGENGQFRTHRHIINMMVALMKPDNMHYFKSGLFSGFHYVRILGMNTKHGRSVLILDALLKMVDEG